jgi:hypothetical protein
MKRLRCFSTAFLLSSLCCQMAMATDFKLDLSPYEVGDIPTALGTNLIVKENGGQKCLTGHANAERNPGRLELNSLNLSNELEVIVNADFNDMAHQILLISNTSELRVIFEGSNIQFGGSNEKVSWGNTGWEGGTAINHLRLSVKGTTAKFYINDVFFQTFVLDNPNAIYIQLVINGLDEDDYICEVRGGNLQPSSNPPVQTDYEMGRQAGRQECINNPASCGLVVSGPREASFTPFCNGNECGQVWALPPEPSDTQGYTPIDRLLPDDGNLWKNPLRFQPQGGFPNSFEPGWYRNAIEGFFQIRYACEASWYSGEKDLPWMAGNVVGAIEYCAYPENIQEVVNHLQAVANKLACENNLPACNQ